MPYAKCKIYSDGSHYIAIPHKPQRPRPKKGAKVRKEGTFIYYYLDMESSVSDQMMAYFQSVKNILSRMPDRTGE